MQSSDRKAAHARSRSKLHSPVPSPKTPRGPAIKTVVDEIVHEYNQKLAELKHITADLPRRLGASPVQPRSPCSQAVRNLEQVVVPEERDPISCANGVQPCSRRVDQPIRHEHRIATPCKTGRSPGEAVPPLRGHEAEDFDEAIDMSPICAPTEQFRDRKSLMEGQYKRTLELMPMWKSSIRDSERDILHAATQSCARANTRAEAVSMTGTSSLPEEDGRSSDTWKVAAYILLPPTSPSRIMWEALGLLFVFYDAITLPIFLAFDPPKGSILKGLDWLSLIYWTINIPMSFTTGYIKNGIYVLQFKKICVHYFKTWLILDACTTLQHWLLVLLPDVTKGTSSLKMFRLLRLVRLLRVVRMMKVGKFGIIVSDFIESEKISIVLHVLKLMFVLVIVNHFIACTWYLISSSVRGNSWLKSYKFRVDDVGFFYTYLVSYHWAITQFTPSSMHVQPQGEIERSFAILVVIFGLAVFSYLVGSINASLGRLRSMEETKTRNLWILRRFLRKNHVPHELSIRIRTQVEHRINQKADYAREESVEVLQLLSEQLKSELALVLHGDALRIHPLLRQLQIDCLGVMRRLSFIGCSRLHLSPGDLMFSGGERATHMSILTVGSMQYERMYVDVSYPEIVDHTEDWICEPVLWVDHWYHLGDLAATTRAELLLINPEKFAELMRKNPLAHHMASSYAQKYVSWLNNLKKETLTDISQGELVEQELRGFVEPASTDERTVLFTHSMMPATVLRSIGRTLHAASRRNSISSLTSKNTQPVRASVA